VLTGNSADSRVAFIPSNEFLNDLEYEPKLPINQEPQPVSNFVKAGNLSSDKLVKVNYYALANAADLSESALLYILK
jgi:hypothetical protein